RWRQRGWSCSFPRPSLPARRSSSSRLPPWPSFLACLRSPAKSPKSLNRSLDYMSTSTSTQIHLASRPTRWPTDSTFSTVTVELPDLAEGEIRVAIEFISVDPYLRGRMNDPKSYAAPYALAEVMTGGAVGRVVESRAEGFSIGDPVLHQLGWR